jgi:hypothetical protein
VLCLLLLLLLVSCHPPPPTHTHTAAYERVSHTQPSVLPLKGAPPNVITCIRVRHDRQIKVG